MKDEPLINAAAMVAIVMAVINLLRTFGVPVTEEQIAAFNELMVYVAPFAVVLLARGKVTPLAAPKDNTGTPLTRPDGTQAVTKKL